MWVLSAASVQGQGLWLRASRQQQAAENWGMQLAGVAGEQSSSSDLVCLSVPWLLLCCPVVAHAEVMMNMQTGSR
jgi:hypothetical protein